jgi:type II secretory pathway pseudopilin PulG
MLNLSAKDWRSLSRPLIVLAVVAILSAVAVVYTRSAVKSAQAQVRTEESALTEARTRVQQSGQEKRVIEQYVEPYRQLERAGVVGEEQRISWIDALRIANQEADLYGVEYNIGPQQPYSFTSEVNAGVLSVRQSIMKLHLGLLHEGDLFRFFQALAAQKVGRFAVNQCSLKRLSVDLAVPVNQPTLNADCEVAWITIAGPSTEEGKS